MKTNINVNVTRIHNIKRTDGTSITFIEVVVTNKDINKTYTIYVHPKYMESGRLLKELKNCIHSCCTNYLPLIDWDSTTGIVEDAVGKFQDAVQDCINKGEIKTYNTLGKNHKAAYHYRYFHLRDEIEARIAAFKGEKVEVEDQPQAKEDKRLKDIHPEEVNKILDVTIAMDEELCEAEEENQTIEDLIDAVSEELFMVEHIDDEDMVDKDWWGWDWRPTKEDVETIIRESVDIDGEDYDCFHIEDKEQVEDQPQANTNTETNKNNNTMNNNREKMMGGAVTTQTGLTINVWGLKNNKYQVKVSWRNRKASFEVEAPKKVADAIYANTADGARVSLAEYMADHLEDIRMPFLLSPNVKKAHKDQWNKNKEEWVAYGKAIAMGWATLDSPHWYAYNKRTNDHTPLPAPVVVEEPQAVEEPQVVNEPQAVVEDTPMVEDQPNELHAEVDNYKVSEECANSIYNVMFDFAHAYSSDLQKCLRQPSFLEIVEDRLIAYYKDFDNRSARELLETIYILKGFINAQAGDDFIDCYVAKATSKWVAAGLPLRVMTRVETIIETIKTEMSGVAGIDGVTNETIKELADIASVSDDDDIVKLYTALSLYQVNRSGRWAKDVRKILYPTTETQEPTSEISKVPQEVKQVVEEPKVDDEEDKHWHVYISTEHNPGTDGYTHYLVNVTRWGSIGGRHKQTDPHRHLMLSFNYYPCLKDNPKENKMVKDIIKGLCMEYKHLLSPSEKYERRFSDNTKNLFEKKVEEGFDTKVKQYENVA